MPRFASLIAPAALAILALPAQGATPNPQIDYAGFVALTVELAETREARRLPWEEFARRMDDENTVLLDTRSAAAFAAGHIEGAVNLPFSDFTDAALLDVLGPDRARPILIYCNNNFSDNIAPVVSKKAPLALNIPTFINLVGYGYGNVWELADVLGIGEVEWVSSPPLPGAQ